MIKISKRMESTHPVIGTVVVADGKTGTALGAQSSGGRSHSDNTGW